MRSSNNTTGPAVRPAVRPAVPAIGGSAPFVRSVVLLGTSITNANSDSTGLGAGYVSTRSAGFGAVAQTVLEHRFALAARSNAYTAANGAPDIDHGYSGATLANLLSGGISGYASIVPVNDAIATGADAVIIEAGANDTALGAAAMAAGIMALVDAVAQHFKLVVLCNVLPRGAAAGATVRDAIRDCNVLLAAAVVGRRNVILFDAWAAIPKDGGGYALADFIHDGTHPSAAGGILIGKALANVIRPYCRADAYVVPSAASGLRLTANWLETGSASLPSGWGQSVSGSSRSYQAITDADGTKWQRFLGTPANASTDFKPYSVLTSQCEAVYANATNANAGTATVTVTSAALAGSPLAVTFAVTAGQTAAQWTEAMRAALAANTSISNAFYVTVSSSVILALTVKVPGRNDPTFRIAVQLPGVGPSTGWARWTTSLYSPGGFAVGDVVRACGILRTVDGLPVTSLALSLTIYDGATKSVHALGYPASPSGAIETVPGLYLTEPVTIPPGTMQILVEVAFRAAGAAAMDVRSAGLFLATP